MGEYSSGLFIYMDKLTKSQKQIIPSDLQIDQCICETILIRLFLGDIKFKRHNDTRYLVQNVDYTVMPHHEITKFETASLENILNVTFSDSTISELCNHYLTKNRKNNQIHELLLSEISLYFYEKEKSPVSSFTHLYRCLEFMSYSFPMIYASLTKDFLGTFTNLKKFLGGDSTGELKFFINFLKELFKDEPLILEYEFEINILSTEAEKIRNEFNTVMSDCFAYSFEFTVLKIKFKDMSSLLINLRNRYFHMLIGQGTKNFHTIDYDINDLFKACNPHFLNWIAVIFTKMVQHGFESNL